MFIKSCALILILTGALKLLDSFGPHPSLLRPEPLSGISYAKVFLMAGMLEIVLAGVLWWLKEAIIGCILVAGFSALAVGYRLLLKANGIAEACACLGLSGKWLPLAADARADIALGLLAYMALGAGLVLATQSMARSKAVVEGKLPV